MLYRKDISYQIGQTELWVYALLAYDGDSVSLEEIEVTTTEGRNIDKHIKSSVLDKIIDKVLSDEI